MTFSSHTLLFEPHSHRFFGKRFGRFLPMDGVRSRIVLPNLSGGPAGKSASRSIRNGNVTTDNVSVIVHNADPPHFHFSRSHLPILLLMLAQNFVAARARQKVIRHGANFPTVFASVRQKAKRRQRFIYRVPGTRNRLHSARQLFQTNNYGKSRDWCRVSDRCTTFSSTR
jgi:hypothetical protein